MVFAVPSGLSTIVVVLELSDSSSPAAQPLKSTNHLKFYWLEHPPLKVTTGKVHFLKLAIRLCPTNSFTSWGRYHASAHELCRKSMGQSRRGLDILIRRHHGLMILDGFIKQYVTGIFCVANIVTAHTGMRQRHGNPGLTHQVKQSIMLINFLIEKRLFGIDFRMTKLIA